MKIDKNNMKQQIEIQELYINCKRQEQENKNNSILKNIMESLSVEDRIKLREQMSLLFKKDRELAISQMKEVDVSPVNVHEYTIAIFNIIKKIKLKETSTNIF